jgi:hypothetical protein
MGSKTWNDRISSITTTRKIVGVSSGRMMNLIRSSRLAPSISAASNYSFEILWRPAKKITWNETP